MRLKIETVAKSVGTYYGVKLNELRGPRRRHWIAHPRQTAMFLAREHNRSTPDIGRYFNRDHTTVIHATRAVLRRIAEDENYAEEVAALRERLQIAKEAQRVATAQMQRINEEWAQFVGKRVVEMAAAE